MAQKRDGDAERHRRDRQQRDGVDVIGQPGHQEAPNPATGLEWWWRFLVGFETMGLGPGRDQGGGGKKRDAGEGTGGKGPPMAGQVPDQPDGRRRANAAEPRGE